MHRADHPNRRAMPVRLHPPGQPFDHRMVEVSGGHRIYVEQYGTPGGLPVVVLHGGPGGGIHPNIRRFFDPKCFHVTLFDQRGCGNSRPHASVENNTTWDLIEDIETIRCLLGISRWIVFGGSWGATLGILYAQQHPERVMQLILRGPFLFTQSELDWFYGGGVAAFFPDQWKKFVEVLPETGAMTSSRGFTRACSGPTPRSGRDTPLPGRAGKTAWHQSVQRTNPHRFRPIMPSRSPGSKTTTSSIGAFSKATTRFCKTWTPYRTFSESSFRDATT